MGIRDRPIALRSPWQNAYVERLQTASVNPERNLPMLRKIAITRLKVRVHPGNPSYTETRFTPDHRLFDQRQPWN
jgi:hypothetical protein